jgi:hypothetical protein
VAATTAATNSAPVTKMEVDNEDSEDFVSGPDSSGPFAHLAAGGKPRAFSERKMSQTEVMACEGPADLSKPGPSGMQISGSDVDVQTATGLQDLPCGGTASTSASGEFIISCPFWKFCNGYETPVHCFVCKD